MAKILVVDDDPSVVSVLQQLLSHSGYSVRTAMSGRDGLASAREEKPDLIILDILMPEIDGITASGMLFQDPVLRQVPVLILTAVGSSRNSFELLPNVRHYMNKPFDNDELLRNIERLLSIPATKKT